MMTEITAPLHQQTRMSRHKSRKPTGIREVKPDAPEPASLFPADRKRGYLIASGATVFTLLCYLLRLDRVFGLMGDDGWYLVLAKSLAVGEGYQLINSPSPGILPIYPPLFPLLISIVWRIWPVFPQNIYLLKSVSIAAMLISGWLVYVHFVRDRGAGRGFGLALGMATVTLPAFVFTATSTVMSECFYTCLQMAAVVAIERAGREPGSWRLASHRLGYALAAGALAAGSFLTRSVGVVVIGAGILYLIKSRLFASAAAFTLGAMVLAGPWLIWQQTHMPTAEQQAEQNSYIVRGYGAQLAEDEVVTESPSGYLDRTYYNLSFFIEHNVGAVLIDSWFRSGEPAVGTGRTVTKAYVSLLLFLISLIGFVPALRMKVTSGDLVFMLTIGLSIVWVFFSARLMFPVAPWLFYYFGVGVRAIVRSMRFSRRRSPQLDWGWAAGAVWLVAAINSFGNLDYILRHHGLVGERPIWVRSFEEHEKTLQWVDRNLPKDAVLTSSNPSMLYLYTGRKTVGNTNPGTSWERWKRMGIRYGVWLKYSPLNDPSETERRFEIPFQSERLKLRVLDFGESGSRRDWSTD